MASGRLLNLLFCPNFELLAPLLSLVLLYLLRCKLIHIPIGKSMLANRPQKQFIGLQKPTLLYDVLLCLRGLWRLRLLFLLFGRRSPFVTAWTCLCLRVLLLPLRILTLPLALLVPGVLLWLFFGALLLVPCITF